MCCFAVDEPRKSITKHISAWKTNISSALSLVDHSISTITDVWRQNFNFNDQSDSKLSSTA